jgi:hypothetical protein
MASDFGLCPSPRTTSTNETVGDVLGQRAGAEEPPSDDDGVKSSQSAGGPPTAAQAEDGEGEKGEAWGLRGK